VIIKQIQSAATLLIDKDITAWFKHARYRYERQLQKHNHSDSDEDIENLQLLQD